jgi:hypothetical protein
MGEHLFSAYAPKIIGGTGNKINGGRQTFVVLRIWQFVPNFSLYTQAYHNS